MFGLKKGKIQLVKENLCVSEHKDYQQVIENISVANRNENPNIVEFNRIKATFPVFSYVRQNITNSFKLDKNVVGFLVIKIKIRDRILDFILDTGAQISCVNGRHIHDDLGLASSDEEINVGGAGNTYGEMPMGYLESIVAVDLELTNLPVLILKREQLTFNLVGNAKLEVDGILGWDVLSLVDFEVDLLNLSVNMVNDIFKERCKNFYRSDYPVVFCMDDKENVRVFGVDTGARKSRISKRLIESNGLVVTKEKESNANGVHGGFSETIAVIKTFQIDILDQRLSFKKIITGDTHLLNDYEFDGLLGRDIFKNRRMVFLNSAQVFYIE